ncbi:MAG: valine--pyruvate aminotransferase [Cellvibrionaceae bacterium]|jgi:valine--pyruvate aminotransferase
MSRFAKRFTGFSGTAALMEDLGNALNNNPELLFMGGGNPAKIDEAEQCFAKHLQHIAQDPQALHKLVGEYQPSQGDPAFLEVLADFLCAQYQWPISAENIAISNGGQSAFFSLFNMLAGDDESGNKNHKKILLPMVPDYLGYADAGLHADMFKTYPPKINLIDATFFKYTIDFDALEIDDDIAAVCLSRPTNPSGNIVTDAEILELKKRCKACNIPLIIDLAYGKPFPNVTFVDHDILWDENTILVVSLSKLGLPGVRTGIVIADKDTIKRFSRATASLSLAPSNLGPTLCKSLIQSGDLLPLIEDTIKPFYESQLQQTMTYLLEQIEAAGLNYPQLGPSDLNPSQPRQAPLKLPKPEGAFFLWLWFQDLPITSQELYQRLKAKGLLVLSGHHFFQPLNDANWQHQHQCLRVNFCQPMDKIKQGIDVLIDEVKELY